MCLPPWVSHRKSRTRRDPRISLGWNTTSEHIEHFIAAWRKHPRPPQGTGRRHEENQWLIIDTIELVKDIDVDKYKYGFATDIESDFAPKGLNEDIVRFISAKKNEPALDAGLAARGLSPLAADGRADLGPRDYPKIDFQDLYYYAAPKSMAAPKSLDEVDPKLLETYAKLGIPLKEQEILAGVGSRARRARSTMTAANMPPARWRSMRCSTRSRSPPPSRRNWPRRA